MASKELEIAKFINIHTHDSVHTSNSSIFCVESLIYGRFPPKLPANYSCGLHPWYLDQKEGPESLKAKLATIESMIKPDTCLMVGETGLDFSSSKLMEFKDYQIQVFMEHIKLSEKYMKPLIIHCVKAFDEILNIHKTHKPKMPWIIHDFNASLDQIQKAQKLNMYFSLGAIFLRANSKIYKLVKELDINHIFFETDELENEMIYKLYEQYSNLANHPLDDVCKKIKNNFYNLMSSRSL